MPVYGVPRVAGTTVPAFVERWTGGSTFCRSSSVAGTTVPAFVERALRIPYPPPLHHRVAGTTVPAFVERWPPSCACVGGAVVSPGLRSRPSLSGLSTRRHGHGGRCCVAGTTVPAFVERRITATASRHPRECRRDYGPGLR